MVDENKAAGEKRAAIIADLAALGRSLFPDAPAAPVSPDRGAEARALRAQIERLREEYRWQVSEMCRIDDNLDALAAKVAAVEALIAAWRTNARLLRTPPHNDLMDVRWRAAFWDRVADDLRAALDTPEGEQTDG